MSSAEEIAKRYLIEEYLMREPDFIDMTEWLDEQDDIEFDGDDGDIHAEAVALLDVLAQRLDDE